MAYRKLLPDWEDYHDFVPLTSGAARRLDLMSLFPTTSDAQNIKNPPVGLPTEVGLALMTISDSGISFAGELVCGDMPDGDVPALTINSLHLDATYDWSGNNPVTSVELGVTVVLSPGVSTKVQQPASMTGSLRYESAGGVSSWTLSACISDLSAGLLYSLFDKDSRDTVSLLLDDVRLQSLQLDYYYASETALPSRFDVCGSLFLGPLALDLNFCYEDGDWTFVATLTSQDDQPATSVGEIIEGVLPGADLPDFVANMAIAAPAITLSLEKDKAAGSMLILALTCVFGAFELSFAQCREKDASSSKRVLKASVAKFPSIVVPMLGDIADMLGEMYYLWVDDPSPSQGLTRQEVQHINAALARGGDGLPFKETKKANNSGEMNPDDIVLASGSHFVLVTKTDTGERMVVIDYVFNASKTKPPPTPQSSPSGGGQSDLVREDLSQGHLGPSLIYLGGGSGPPVRGSRGPGGLGSRSLLPPPPPLLPLMELKSSEKDGGDSESSDSVMAPYRKSFGALSISNIGFRYANGVATLLVDAAIGLGPVGLALLGAGVGLDLRGLTLDTLPESVELSLEGLAVSFQRPPVEIAGLFRKSGDTYRGGLLVAITPYTIEAAGFYGQIHDDSQEGGTFPSVFVFAKLDGPLVELEFGEISGLTGGFGYNTNLNFPSAADVPDFPFISTGDLPDDPMATLQTLVGSDTWFFPEKGADWLAAGLRVDAFQVLAVSAVVMAKWENGGLKLDICGLGAANIPPGNKGPRFGRIELGMVASLDFVEGVVKLESQISPRSFLLDTNCHPTGGAALAYWFAPNKYEGDWVFTLGGYHQAFQVPSHYPVPPRLGISWNVSDIISIRGEAYFAITPAVCMAGGTRICQSTHPPPTLFPNANI